MRLRIGSRGSELALWQANEVALRLRDAGYESEIVTFRTSGDKRRDVSLAQIGGKGLFVKELEEALARREIDLAVHSLKDVPSLLQNEFILAGFLERADPRDAWLQIDKLPISQMPEGARIGTSSPRRRAQLLSRYPHLSVEPMRGNVDTRIAKLHSRLYDGVVLAAAGLTRLGRASEITSLFDVDEMVPAAGQGIIAIETLRDHAAAREAARTINASASELAADCERGVLQRFGTLLDCHSPVAVHATIDGQTITIRALISDLDGKRAIRAIRSGSAEIVEQVADDLIAQGALEILRATRSPAPSVRPSVDRDPTGVVFLVGAGPGDPSLLTLRAAELIERADVVAIDALVSPEIAARIRKATEVIYVGKRAGAHSVPQEQINRILIEEARKGRQVVRLKGGDPFVFGRGGEEAEEIAAAGISVEIVPGISSATAGPAYAGIPVTHRAHAASLTIVTGHESDESTGVPWSALAGLDGTIVFLMGFGNLPLIVRKLIENGVPATRPVAVISKATTPEQQTVTGTLADIESRAAAVKLTTPALVVVGDVVRVREAINWFESKPLFGKRIVITRAREQASELKRLLEESGAQVMQFPTIEIAPPESYESLDRTIDALADYQWLIFTSVNGVRLFFDRLAEKGKDTRALAGAMIAAVGTTTASELRAHGIDADVIPKKFQSSALLPLLDEDQRGIRTAVVRAAEGREELIDELRRRGGEADLVIAYRTVAADYDLDQLEALIEGDSIDVVTFASASSADHFFSKLDESQRARLAARAMFASIGPTTSEAIRRHGKAPEVEASNATLRALHDAIVERLRR